MVGDISKIQMTFAQHVTEKVKYTRTCGIVEWMNTEMHKRGRPKNKMAAEAKSNKSSNSQKMTALMAFLTDCSASDISKRKRLGPMISTIIGPVAMCLVRLSSASR